MYLIMVLIFSGLLRWGDMSNLGEFLSRLGNLHDCTVTLFEWRPDDRRVTFAIEDLYFNFEGLPEYRGPLSGRIVLEEVQRVDIDLGGMSGIELQHRLASCGSAIPIIFMTALDDEATRARALETGCVACLFKPFVGRSLIDAVKIAVARQ